MKKVTYISMAIAFIMAGISAMMFYGQGFHTWFWQIIVMIWVAYSYYLQKTIDNNNYDA